MTRNIAEKVPRRVLATVGIDESKKWGTLTNSLTPRKSSPALQDNLLKAHREGMRWLVSIMKLEIYCLI